MTPIDSPESLCRTILAEPVPASDSLAVAHLLLRLRPINRALKVAAEARGAFAARLMQPDPHNASITEAHVKALFAEVDGVLEGGHLVSVSLALTRDEGHRQDRMRAAARARGLHLPLDAMQQDLDLTDFEVHAVLLCAAPQLFAAYQRIFAYVHDDLNRLAPSLELISALAAPGLAERIANREALAPHGRLCRLGLLGIDSDPAITLHREYSLTAAALAALTRGTGTDWARRFRDAGRVETDTAFDLSLFPDRDELRRIAVLLSQAGPRTVGLWGREHCGGADIAAALAKAAKRMLRRLPAITSDDAALAQFLRSAEALDAVVMVDSNRLRDSAELDPVVERLALSAASLICIGNEPWRPAGLVASRPFVDLTLRPAGRLDRVRMWQSAAPGADLEGCQALAVRFRFSPGTMRAADAVARAAAALSGGDAAAPYALPQAARTVAVRRASQFARPVLPRRRPEDLILPADLHRRVLEVAAFHRSWSQVDEAWGFGRLLSGGGVKVLMAGDSGTGKTAAAEVIAGEVDRDQPMLKVHLASVVSKWVGETEKNLDAVFEFAEESHAVLFFDEADSLFAKRGEVERGSDRYANLEVGFLLQRLEDFAGVAILASNHRDQIDEAFMRRFQVVLHFPRPGPAERLRLWQMALPPEAPRAGDIDFDLLQKLELTGAGIVNAARMAAMLAATETNPVIGMAHLVPAVARQFQHEARLLPVTQLGRYGHLVSALQP